MSFDVKWFRVNTHGFTHFLPRLTEIDVQVVFCLTSWLQYTLTLTMCVSVCALVCCGLCEDLGIDSRRCLKNGLAFSQHMRPSLLVFDLAWLVLGSGWFRVVLTSVYSKWSVCVIEWPLLMMFMPRWEEMLHKQSWQRVFGSLSTFDWWLALNRLSPHYLPLCLFLPFLFCFFLPFNKMMVWW